MPSFIPKSLRKPDYPACVDLAELFNGERFRPSTTRVINYLHNYYARYSDDSFERISRPATITEAFNVLMPTADAYLAEIELCNAIYGFASGTITEEKIKVFIQKYLETHTVIYEKSNNRPKSGDWTYTGFDVPLYYLDYFKFNTGGTMNAVQLEIYTRFEKKSGNNAEYRITQL